MQSIWRAVLISLVAMIAAAPSLRAQSAYLGPAVGVHGAEHLSVEIGFGRYALDDPHGGLSSGYAISTEFIPGSHPLLGPQVSGWFSGRLLDFGMSLICYTDFHESSLRLRPEIGLGFENIRLVYGYAIPLTNSDFKGINVHDVSFRWTIPAFRIKY